MTRTVRALRSTWGVREFIAASVRRDFAARYLGTQLGFFWAIAQPLALILIYTVVFAEIMKPLLPGYERPYAYGIYLCAGMLVWHLFNEILDRCIGVFVGNANLLKKVSLPKIALPSIVALSGLVNFAVIFSLFAGFLLLIDAFPGLAVFALVPVLLVVMAFALGLGVLLGTVNVFYRDVAHFAGMAMTFWFWLTPIVYPLRSVPEWLATALEWNPLAPLVGFVQTLFLDNRIPDWELLAYPGALALASTLAGLFVFRRLGGEIVDAL